MHVLDEVSRAGYGGIDLGPVGYLGIGAELGEREAARHLGLAAAQNARGLGADGSREPVPVGAVGQGTVRWTEHERLVYLIEPYGPCCAGSENPGSASAAMTDLQALGSIMMLDQAGGPSGACR